MEAKIKTILFATSLLIGLSWNLSANTPPVSTDMTFEAYEGVSVEINLDGYDEESFKNYMEFVIIDDVGHGTLELAVPGTFPNFSFMRIYTPDPGYTGIDQFTFQIYDGTDSSKIATATITVSENEAPVAKDFTIDAITSTPKIISFPVSDDATKLSDIDIVIVDSPQHGQIEVDLQYRLLYYRSNSMYIGSDSFTYKAIDQQGNESAIKKATVNVLENTPPELYPSNMIVLKNMKKENICFHFNDPDKIIQNVYFEIVDSPGHGTINDLSSFSGSYSYTPNNGFTGIDEFTVRAFDSVEYSAPTKIKVLVIEPGQPNGATVLVVVPESYYDGLKLKIDRLLNDLDNDGYNSKLKLWTGGNEQDLWSYLQKEYRNSNQFVSGAILIGKDLPTMKLGDISYWNLREFSEQNDYLRKNDIWVSRFESDDLVKLGYALDANHLYRTHQSRLPYDAYRALADEYTHDPESLANMENIWDNAIDLSNSKVDVPMTQGAEIVYRSDHNAPGTGTGPYQCRFAFISGCKAGRIVKDYQYTRGGSNIFSVGRKEDTGFGYYEIDNKCKGEVADLLNQGAAWGHILNQGLDTLAFKYSHTYFFGDLSVPAKNNPRGQLPAIDQYNSCSTELMAGEKVDFSVIISDPDANNDDNVELDYEHKVEWFLHEYFIDEKNMTYQEPVLTTTTDQPSWDAVTYTFDQPHNYNTRIEVQDEWYARTWEHKEIIVKPNPKQALRINLGTYSGHDTYFVDYTDGDGNVWLYQEEYNSGKGNWGWQDGGCGRSSDNGKPVTSEISNSEVDPVYWYWNNICDKGPSYLKVPLANDTYTINIHVADMKSGGNGERMLDAWIEGDKVLDGLDAYKEAGSKKALIKTFTAEVTDGELTLKFEKNAGSTNDASVSAIEILPQGINTYTITATANKGGSISQSGTVSVHEGSDKTFIITPDENYEVEDVKVNGSSKGAKLTYTFTNVTSDQSIEVDFREVTTPVYTITSSAGMYGKISPLGEIKVEKGQNQSFTITPDEGCYIVDVKIDNDSKGDLGTYEFKNVSSNHEIKVIFASKTATSVNETDISETILFPNPVEDRLHVNEPIKIQSITLYDMSGKLLKSILVEESTTTINMTDFDKGLYLLRVISQNGNLSIHKIIKQ